jgi:hypothetical protein
LYWWANRFNVNWLDKALVSSVTMCFIIVFDPVVWVHPAKPLTFPVYVQGVEWVECFFKGVFWLWCLACDEQPPD